MVHPKYVFLLCVVIAVIVLPTLVFFGIIEANSFFNAIVVGALGAASVLYKSSYNKKRQSS